MRLAGALALLLAGSLAALAQEVPPQPTRVAAAAAKSKAKKPPPAVESAKSTYDAMSQADRVGIQSDLIWTGDYNGIADGDFNERSIQAVKAFQEKQGNKGTGVLNVQERALLTETAAKSKDAAGWKIVDDKTTGVRLGLPTKLAPQPGEAKSGDTKSRWQSAKGEVQIETFRVNPATLATVFDQQRKQPANRQVDYSVMKDNFFVISGLQGLKKFYVRGQIKAGDKNGDVRGVAILYDQAMDGIMEPVVVAMSSAFTPFPTGALVAAVEGPAPKRAVDYGTGIVVSAAGDVVTDREVVDECRFIVVPGYGHAERVADDKESSLALIRLNGVQNLKPVAIEGDVPRGSDVTLVGIADPERQDGGGAVTTAKAKLAGNGAGSARAVEPAPALGFSGGAAIEADQRFVGMVVLKPQGAAMTDAITIRHFLDAQKVKTEAGVTQDAKSSVLRVICVRK
jgi:peptidoglycan hydrolase-like protein with peptidoglycan-binding domain